MIEPTPARPDFEPPRVDGSQRSATPQVVNDPATTDAGSVVDRSGFEPHDHSAATERSSPATSGECDDASDVAAALGGDDIAFARLYDRHAPLVLAICRRSAPGHSTAMRAASPDADDALQETFIRAHRLLASLESPTRIRSWLLGIARRVCSEGRRASGRRRRHEEIAMTATSSRESDRMSTEESAVRDEALDRLGGALDRLPEEERLAIHLYYLDPDPVRAAGDALGLSRSGFYKLLARARAQLAAMLGELNPDDMSGQIPDQSPEGSSA